MRLLEGSTLNNAELSSSRTVGLINNSVHTPNLAYSDTAHSSPVCPEYVMSF